MASNEIEIRVRSRDLSAPGLSSSTRRLGGLQQQAHQVREELRRLSTQPVNPRVTADTALARAELARVEAEMRRVAEARTTVEVDADTATARDDLTRLREELQRLNALPTSPEVTAQTAAASAAITDIEERLRELDRERVRIQVRVDDEGSVSRLSRLRTALAGLGPPLAMVGAGFRATLKPLALIGSGGGGVAVLAGLAAAAQQLAPAALLLPGALLAGAAAMGTFKLATSGVEDALSAATPEAYAKALEKLSPAARETVVAIKGMAPEFQKIKSAVQDSFFAGFAGDIKALGTSYMPILKTGLVGIADGFNGMGRSALQAANTPFFKGAVTQILGDTKTAIGNMKPALGDALTGFVGLGAIGSTYLPKLGTAISGVADKFKTWVSDNPEKIKAMIDGAIAGFKDLFTVVGNVGSIIGSIFSGLSGEVSSPLASLAELTGRLKEFFATAAAQGPLQALGETLRVVSGVLGDVLLAGLKAIGPLIEALAPIVQTLASAVGDILVGAFEKLGPPLTRFFTEYGPAIQAALSAIATFVVDVVIPAIAALINWLIDVGIPAFVQFAGAIAIAMTDAVTTVSGAISGILGFLASLLDVLAQIPGPMQQAFAAGAQSARDAKGQVDSFNQTMANVRSKTVELLLQSDAQKRAADIQRSIQAITGKTVWVTVNQRDGIRVASLSGNGGGMTERMQASGGPGGGMTWVGERGPELVRGMATGGVTGKGMRLVGESGPELVRMPQGSTVIPHGQTRTMMQGAGQGGGAVTVQLTAGSGADGMFATMIMQMVRSGILQLKTA